MRTLWSAPVSVLCALSAAAVCAATPRLDAFPDGIEAAYPFARASLGTDAPLEIMDTWRQRFHGGGQRWGVAFGTPPFETDGGILERQVVRCSQTLKLRPAGDWKCEQPLRTFRLSAGGTTHDVSIAQEARLTDAMEIVDFMHSACFQTQVTGYRDNMPPPPPPQVGVPPPLNPFAGSRHTNVGRVCSVSRTGTHIRVVANEANLYDLAMEPSTPIGCKFSLRRVTRYPARLC